MHRFLFFTTMVLKTSGMDRLWMYEVLVRSASACDSDSVMTGSRFSADLQSGGRIASKEGEGSDQSAAAELSQTMSISCGGAAEDDGSEKIWPAIDCNSSSSFCSLLKYEYFGQPKTIDSEDLICQHVKSLIDICIFSKYVYLNEKLLLCLLLRCN